MSQSEPRQAGDAMSHDAEAGAAEGAGGPVLPGQTQPSGRPKRRASIFASSSVAPTKHRRLPRITSYTVDELRQMEARARRLLGRVVTEPERKLVVVMFPTDRAPVQGAHDQGAEAETHLYPPRPRGVEDDGLLGPDAAQDRLGVAPPRHRERAARRSATGASSPLCCFLGPCGSTSERRMMSAGS